MAAQSLPPIVLLTRPEAQSARFAEALHARMPGLGIVCSPLLSPRFMPVTLPAERFAALILTSQTGAQAAGRLRAALPDRAYCVGASTAQTAQEAGFAALSAEGDAEALLALILAQPMAPLLHLRGREARGDLARRLSAQGLPTQELVVYAQEECPLTAEARTLLQGDRPVLAPVFSPRSAQILRAACAEAGARAPLTLIAMSPAVAEAAGTLAARVEVSPLPTGDSMLECVVRHWGAGLGA